MFNSLIRYVSLTEGKICFCGRAAPTGSTVDAAANCNMPCPGDSAKTCGGANHVYVYKAPVVVDGLEVADPCE